MINLKYKIKYTYDYATNAVVVTLTSPYFEKEYSCPNLGNMWAVVGHAIVDFNELHKYEIEELESHEEEAKQVKKPEPDREKYRRKQAESKTE